jgi:hypothetical protein
MLIRHAARKSSADSRILKSKFSPISSHNSLPKSGREKQKSNKSIYFIFLSFLIETSKRIKSSKVTLG